MADTKPGPPFFYKAGLHNVGSYQVSGRPWITGSDEHPADVELKVSFPSVAKSFTVVNFDSSAGNAVDIYVHFAPRIEGTTTVANKHYLPLGADKDAYTFNTKCTDVYISTPSGNARIAKWRIVAELTGIQASSMFELTGSGITE
jgi:hypothetical protein